MSARKPPPRKPVARFHVTVEYETEGGERRRMTSEGLINSSALSLCAEFQAMGHPSFVTEVIPPPVAS